MPSYGGRRRVLGLRREEVALLAGVSVDYYTRLERGDLRGVSETVLDAVANALHLDEPERDHLINLAQAANSTQRVRRRPPQDGVRPTIQRILDAMTGAPAYVRNGRRDILAANRLGYALYSELEEIAAAAGRVGARVVFLNPRARTFFVEWPTAANDIVAALRAEAGKHPYDRELSGLVGELSTRSEEFASRWAAQNVRFHRSGFKAIHHPIVGDLHLTFEVMDLPADPGLSLVVYSAEPGSGSQDALKLLASWTTNEEEPTAAAIDQLP